MLAFALIALFIGTALASATVLVDSGLRGIAAMRTLRAELTSLGMATGPAPSRQARRALVIRAGGQRRVSQPAMPALLAAA